MPPSENSQTTSVRGVIYKLQSDKWDPILEQISDIHVSRDPDRILCIAPDSTVLLDLTITKHFEYVKASVFFHQFAESNSIYGLNFASEDDANRFAESISSIMKKKKKKTSKKKRSTVKKKSNAQKPKEEAQTSSIAEEETQVEEEEEEEIIETKPVFEKPKNSPPAPPPKKSLPPLPPKKGVILPPSPQSSPKLNENKNLTNDKLIKNTSVEGEKLPPELENLKKEIFSYIDQIKNEILESLSK